MVEMEEMMFEIVLGLSIGIQKLQRCFVRRLFTNHSKLPIGDPWIVTKYNTTRKRETKITYVRHDCTLSMKPGKATSRFSFVFCKSGWTQKDGRKKKASRQKK